MDVGLILQDHVWRQDSSTRRWRTICLC